MEPKITVLNDYNGYFERLVRRWLKECPSGRSEIVISASPYRSCAVSCRVDQENVLHLDFYSAIRNGFGSLSKHDVDELQQSMFWK